MINENNKNCTIVLNTNIIQFLNSGMVEPKFCNYSRFFPPCILSKKVSGCEYIHALIFKSNNARNKALSILEKYKKDANISYSFFYNGEKVTTEMINDLIANHGDFQCWENI